MPLTLDYMRSIVLSRLDDADFETTYLDQALNEAQWDLLNKRNLTFLETSQTAVMLAGTNTVPYPSDIRTLTGVRVVAAGIQSYDITENFVDYADFQLSNYPQTAVTTPLWWTTYAGNMIFPGLADKDYTVTFDYIKKASRVDGVTVNTFLIPDEFQELLKIGAYMRIAKREDDYDVKNQEQLDFEKLKIDMIHAYSRNRGPRNKHVMRVIR